MEHFFYNDNLYSDLEEFLEYYGIDYDNVNNLPDTWSARIEHSDLEPIFEVDAEIICQLLADSNEDRLSEDFDEEKKVLKALKESIAFEKLKELLPKLYYANGKFETITKKDILNYFKKTS